METKMAEHPHFDILTVEHRFHAPRAKVFAAFGDRRAFEKWACPSPEVTNRLMEFDFRVGGVATMHMSGEGMPDFVNCDRFEEIVLNERIIQISTLRAGGELDYAGAVTLLFEDDGEGTRIIMTEQGVYPLDPSSPEMHREGWQAMFASLDTYLQS
jgi:uncharacterized protein YndB with AHSA1/START domain